jgi:hypothetical protein
MTNGVVGRRIGEALRYLIAEDYENSLIFISPALEATAKKKWSKYKPGRRTKSFISEYEAFIYQFASSGMLVLAKGGKISINGELSNTIYKHIRCPLAHGEAITNVQFSENVVFGIENGVIVLNAGVVYGLLFSILVDDKNKSEKCDPELQIIYGANMITLNECWGNLEKVEKLTGYKKHF